MIKEILLVIVGIGILVGGGIFVKIAFFPVNTLQKEIDIAYNAQNKVLNADNAIYNYEWFKQRFEDIQATKNKLDNVKVQHNDFVVSLPTDKTNWSWEDKGEDNRLRAVEIGIQNQIENLIADYNARTKMATRNIFEDNVLPSYIDALTFIKK